MRCKCAGDGWGVSGLVHYCISVLFPFQLCCRFWNWFVDYGVPCSVDECHRLGDHSGVLCDSTLLG